MVMMFTFNSKASPVPVETTPSDPVIEIEAMTPEDQIPLDMITSKEALRAYAEELSSHVSASIGTTLPAGGDRYTYTRITDSTASGILKAISDIRLSVEIVNPKDPLYTYAGVYDEYGHTLLSGYKSFFLTGPDSSGAYSMPLGYGSVSLELNDLIPIFIGGATYAAVSDLGSDGRSQMTHNLQVYKGWILYPRQLVGGNRVFSVYASGVKNQSYVDNWLFWETKSGEIIDSSTYIAGFNASIKGVKTIEDSNVSVNIFTYKGYGENTSVELKVSAPFTAGVSFSTTENKWFTSAMVRKMGTDKWSLFKPSWNASKGIMVFQLPVEVGTYVIIPIWSEKDLIEPVDKYYDYYDNSKG